MGKTFVRPVSSTKRRHGWLAAGVTMLAGLLFATAQPTSVSAAEITPSATTTTSDGKLATAFSQATMTTAGQVGNWSVPASLSNVQGDLDIAFYVDSSPSMDSVINDVKNGMKKYMQNLHNSGAQNIRVALFNIDGSVVSDFAPYDEATFADRITNGLNGAGGEYQVIHLTNSISGLSWRPSATRNVVLIADTYLTWNSTADASDQAQLDALATVAKNNHVTMSLMYADDNGFNLPNNNFAVLSGKLGVDFYQPKDEASMVTGLTESVTNPSGKKETHKYTYSVESKYVSDGAVSNDIIVTVTPGNFTLTSGQAGKFTMQAKVKDLNDLGRRNDTTKVVVHYYIDGVEQTASAQTLTYKAPAPTPAKTLPKTEGPKTPAPKKTTNAKLPQTGEAQNSAVILLGMIVLSATALFAFNKRRVNK